MAYLDLSEPRLALAATAPVARQRAVNEQRFSAEELAVIALSRHDSPATLSAPGRVRRFLDTLFDIRRGNALADPRLEALRRMAILLRRGIDRISSDETARFLASGYSCSHFKALAGHVARVAR